MKNRHHFLILTGIFSIIAGLYTFIIPSGYYPVFTPVIDLAFFTLGLSGIIFSSHRFKILDHIIWYCIYSSIIFIFSISISNHTVEMRLFLIGAICLYQYMWQLYHGLFLRKQKYPASIIILVYPGLYFQVYLSIISCTTNTLLLSLPHFLLFR